MDQDFLADADPFVIVAIATFAQLASLGSAELPTEARHCAQASEQAAMGGQSIARASFGQAGIALDLEGDSRGYVETWAGSRGWSWTLRTLV